MNPATVSFLMPFRDAEATLDRAIASCLDQSVSALELVLVDDGSRDTSAAIAAAWAERDTRVRLVRGPPRGIVAGLNEGMERCSGSFVARMDADDFALPNRLERQLDAFLEDPALVVVDGRVELFRDGDPVPRGMSLHAEWINSILEPDDFRRAFALESPVVHPAATIRASALQTVGGYRDGDFPEDYDLWLRLERCGARFRKVPELVVRMNDRENRLTRTDARYRIDAFRQLAQGWLADARFDRPRQTIVWGAGRGARPWLAWLNRIGQTPVAIVDVDPGKIGRTRDGVPIESFESLPSIAADTCLVAVATRGARTKITAALRTLRPDWQEGVHWWHVAC